MSRPVLAAASLAASPAFFFLLFSSCFLLLPFLTSFVGSGALNAGCPGVKNDAHVHRVGVTTSADMFEGDLTVRRPPLFRQHRVTRVTAPRVLGQRAGWAFNGVPTRPGRLRIKTKRVFFHWIDRNVPVPRPRTGKRVRGDGRGGQHALLQQLCGVVVLCQFRR